MKRKRDDEEDDTSQSATPPTKIRAASPDSDAQPRCVVGPSMPPQPAQNDEGINTNDEDSNDAGPASAVGPQRPETEERRVVGPSMPPQNNDEDIALDESDDDIRPAMPPSAPAQARAKQRVMGPAPPPAPLDEMPSRPSNDEDSDSDSDDYGPSLPPPPGSAAAYAAEAERAEVRAETARAASNPQPKKIQRDDWMMVPPSDSDWGSRVDPTKLKSRKFASGKGATAPSQKGSISAIWTETPEEKRQRLEDEVMGRKEMATSSDSHGHRDIQRSNDDGEEEAIARRIRQYNEKQRGPSLVEQHKGKSGGNGVEDDPSKRAFDHEKDMAIGGSLGHMQKRELLKKAGDFGSRFERGKFL